MKRGFTLIELLVVVVIIGVLAAVAVPQYTKAVEKSRTVEAITMMENIVTGERIYKLTHGEYTRDLTALDIEYPRSESHGRFYPADFDGTVQVDSSDGSVLIFASRGYALGIHMTLDGVITRYCDDGDSNVKICSSMPDWEPFPAVEPVDPCANGCTR